MKKIIAAAVSILVAAASLWMISPANAYPTGVVAAPSDVPVPKAAAVGSLDDRTPPSSPSELRSRLLYGDRELSAFRQSSTRAVPREETRLPMRPFDPQTEDRWIAFDKVQHLTFSFLWTLGTQYVVVNKGRISEQHALPLSITSSAAAGVSKEVYDLRMGPTRHFSTKDLVADAVGILLAVGVILL